MTETQCAPTRYKNVWGKCRRGSTTPQGTSLLRAAALGPHSNPTPPHNRNRLTMTTPDQPMLEQIPSNRFTNENSADSNRVFLWEASSEPPFMRAVNGWRIVGYGPPPWPKGDTDVAVMFEKTTPAEGYGSLKGEEMDEGTRIWQHARGRWIPGHPDHEKWMIRARKL